MKRLHLLQPNHPMRHVTRFMIVGVLGTLLDLVLFSVLRLWLGLPALVANSISYSAGIANNYIWHRNWTYSDKPVKAPLVQVGQFVLVSLSALLLNNAIVLVLAQPLGQLLGAGGYGDAAAKLCATVVGMAWNFLANHFWTFHSTPREAQHDTYTLSDTTSAH